MRDSCTTADLCTEAAKAVWASKWGERAAYSRNAAGVPHSALQMAVLVQKVVNSQYAFVVHTTNPVTGSADEIMVSLGLGDESSWNPHRKSRHRIGRQNYSRAYRNGFLTANRNSMLLVHQAPPRIRNLGLDARLLCRVRWLWALERLSWATTRAEPWALSSTRPPERPRSRTCLQNTLVFSSTGTL